MRQAHSSLPVDGELIIGSAPGAQRRNGHGLFRYFGKLAPDVTASVLSEAVDLLGRPVQAPVIDVMCGSGTTLIEAALRGYLSVGIDVNPLALLYARVKTRAICRTAAEAALEQAVSAPARDDATSRVFAATRNAERWFTPHARTEVARLRCGIEQLPDSAERDLLLAVLLSRVRAISNASARTGRIFFDPDSAVSDPCADFVEYALRAFDEVPERDMSTSVVRGTATCPPIRNGSADIILCHPPYFALYRYSSDVLRFELEIGGWSRRAIQSDEIADGWKSGDPANLELFVRDLQKVFVASADALAPRGVFALVVANSTLGDVQMPVVDRLAAAAAVAGLTLERHLERKMHFGSALYHRSARVDKVIDRDHVLLFRSSDRGMKRVRSS